MSLTDNDHTDTAELRQQSGAIIAESIDRSLAADLSTSGLCFWADCSLGSALRSLNDADRALDELAANRGDAPDFDYADFRAALRTVATVMRQVRKGVTP